MDSTNHRPKVLRKLHKAKLECQVLALDREDEGVRARPAVAAAQGWVGANTPPPYTARRSGILVFRCLWGSWGQCPEGSREDCVGSSWHFIPESTGFVEDILVGLSVRPERIQQ